ncbi:MAG: hypothetical protein IJA32_05355 [Lachnospiraceae bacterium]|nr:hypothetical protein [Lachnospiraceae bacterium]
MKNGAKFLVFAGIVIILIIIAINVFSSKSFDKISESDVAYISVKIIPEALDEKEIRDKEQIEEIVRILNSIITKKSDGKNKEKGWEIMLTFSYENETYNISIIGNKIICNGYIFNTSSDNIDELKKLIR